MIQCHIVEFFFFFGGGGSGGGIRIKQVKRHLSVHCFQRVDKSNLVNEMKIKGTKVNCSKGAVKNVIIRL